MTSRNSLVSPITPCASLYSLSAGAEEAFSRAYAPVLIACLTELRERTSTPQLIAFLKRVGKRLADGFTPPSGSLSSRVSGASDMLNALGGVTSVEKSGSTYHIVGRACPLSPQFLDDRETGRRI